MLAEALKGGLGGHSGRLKALRQSDGRHVEEREEEA
jgi:hypothetical protein